MILLWFITLYLPIYLIIDTWGAQHSERLQLQTKRKDKR